MIGSRIRHYNLIKELGSGGMGTVYLAEDTKLRRKVALKFLSPQVSADAETMERFEREAQAAAALNHPSIVTIYEIGESEGQKYIAMEYAGGETLRTKIAVGQMPMDEVLAIGKKVCEGLGKAHEKGIVHRDIKPENILITEEGEVKILDFGIAKLKGAANLTKESMTVGTTRYMSPEQVKGEGIDPRSDIWSVGIVLYEMLTGASPFKGDYDSAIMYSILSEKPEPISDYRKDVPENVQAVVLKALQKEKRKRYETMDQLAAALSGAAVRSDEESTVTMVTRSGRPKAWVWVPGVVALVVAVALFTLLQPSAPPRPNVASMKKVTFVGDVAKYAFSPDGSYAVYVSAIADGVPRLTVQDLTGGSTIQLLSARLFGRPAWSPDGSTIAISAVINDSTSGVYILPRLGGTPRRLLAFPMPELAWSPDGNHIAMSDGGKRVLFARTISGDTTSHVLGDQVGKVLSIDWSPDGEALLVHSLGDRYTSIWELGVGSGIVEPLYHETFVRNTMLLSPVWSPDGDAIYFIRQDFSTRADELMKLPLDSNKSPAGDPYPVAVNFRNIQSIDMTRDGKMLARKENAGSNLWLVRPGPSGVSQDQLTRGTARRTRAALSPDRKRVVFGMMDAEGYNIYTMPLDMQGEKVVGGSPRKLTSLTSLNISPVWSPDGKEIAFLSNKGGRMQVWKVGAGGEALKQFDGTAAHPDTKGLVWAPGAEVIFAGPENHRLYALDPASGETRVLLEDLLMESIDSPIWSPDGGTVAVRVFYGWDDPLTGIWLMSGEDSKRQLSGEWDLVPLSWSKEGSRIYTLKVGTGIIHTIDVRKGLVREYIELPFESVDHKMLTMSADGTFFLYNHLDIRRDLWLVEDFDPELE
ncbi:MAG: protein kinase [Bacteroidota bacterium]